MAGPAYASTAKVHNFVTQVARRIEGLPGVEAAASAIMLPVQCCVDLPINIPGKPLKEGQQYNGDEQWRSVSPQLLPGVEDPAGARAGVPRDRYREFRRGWS